MAINILDKHTANLIAAGEVVERPASAIKEMLENSADAGATRITVEIQNGGTTYFRVTDNGAGMSSDDLPRAILRHATSKISCPSDLSKIGTYGFRGEALAAIAAVCDLRILTKRREDTFGSVLHVCGGEILESGEAGCPDGTTIAASDIFKNIPARRKFLKKDVTEANACLAVTEKFALSRPDVAVTFLADGNVKLKTAGDGNLKNTIYSCLGKEFASKLLELDYTYEGIRISGFIGKPETARPGRSMQNFFVNGRYVRSGTVCAALEEGFRAFCPAGKFPAAVIFCELDFSRVDVNIHPAKTEVKFSEEKKVFEAVLFAVRTALNRGTSYSPASERFSEQRSVEHTPFKTSVPPQEKPPMTAKELTRAVGIGEIPHTSTSVFREADESAKKHENIYNNADFTDNSVIKEQNDAFIAEEKQAPKSTDVPFGEVPKNLPTANANTVSVPDFRNAFSADSEGITDLSFGKKTDEALFVRTSVPGEGLDIFVPEKRAELFPDKTQETPKEEQLSFELPEDKNQKNIRFHVIGECFDSFILVEKDDILYIIDKHAAHERILYEEIKNSAELSAQTLLEPVRVVLSTEECAALTDSREYFEKTGFDFDTFGKNSIIVRAYPEHIEKSDLNDVFASLASKLIEGNGQAAGDIFDRALFSAACKAAVKAGQRNTLFQDEYIAEKIFSSEAILYCPHGRPVITEFTKEKLYKMFKRT